MRGDHGIHFRRVILLGGELGLAVQFFAEEAAQRPFTAEQHHHARALAVHAGNDGLQFAGESPHVIEVEDETGFVVFPGEEFDLGRETPGLLGKHGGGMHTASGGGGELEHQPAEPRHADRRNKDAHRVFSDRRCDGERHQAGAHQGVEGQAEASQNEHRDQIHERVRFLAGGRSAGGQQLGEADPGAERNEQQQSQDHGHEHCVPFLAGAQIPADHQQDHGRRETGHHVVRQLRGIKRENDIWRGEPAH